MVQNMVQNMAQRTSHPNTGIIEEVHRLNNERERLEKLLAFFTERTDQVRQRLGMTRQLVEKMEAVSRQVDELMTESGSVREENTKVTERCNIVADAPLYDEAIPSVTNEDRVARLKKENHEVNTLLNI